MTLDDVLIHVVPINGRPQRLVNVVHRTHGEYRDNIDTNSAVSRKRFIENLAKALAIDAVGLEWLNDALVEKADEADRLADEAAGDDGERDG